MYMYVGSMYKITLWLASAIMYMCYMVTTVATCRYVHVGTRYM